MSALDRLQHFDAWMDPVTQPVPANDLHGNLQRQTGR